MNNLELENSVLREMLQDTLWMARRYAHTRQTYAPGLVNQIIDQALALNIKVDEDMTIGMYATDGTFGRWDSKTKSFVKDA